MLQHLGPLYLKMNTPDRLFLASLIGSTIARATQAILQPGGPTGASDKTGTLDLDIRSKRQCLDRHARTCLDRDVRTKVKGLGDVTTGQGTGLGSAKKAL